VQRTTHQLIYTDRLVLLPFFQMHKSTSLDKNATRKSLHSFTWQYSTHIAWRNDSKKTQVCFCPDHMAFTDCISTWKTLINHRSKYVFYLVFVMHQLTVLHSQSPWTFSIYSVTPLFFFSTQSSQSKKCHLHFLHTKHGGLT